MRDNRGFSLIEAIVVIAILAVLAAGAAVGLGQLSGWRVTGCASDINSAMNNTRMNAMSKYSAYMEISRGADGAWYLEETGETKKKIAPGNITVSYVASTSTDVVEITETNHLIFSYNRSSGAFTPMISQVNADGSYTFLTETQPDGSTGGYVYCSKIIISDGSRTKTITLMKDTGKHTLD